jgi:hypothetical protein
MDVPLTLYCKSHRLDLKRVVRLSLSIQRFNAENIPFFVSVPPDDVSLFQDHLVELNVTVLNDEAIIIRNSAVDLEKFRLLPGNVSQQIVKSEFWRMGFSSTYMCLDSDALFIRPFRKIDYLFDKDLPYTVMDEGQEFLSLAMLHDKQHIFQAYVRDAQKVQKLLGRVGKNYSFGPFPVLWHKAVWESLDKNYLIPNGINIMQALQDIETESYWYGEALLKYKAIPLMPCQPLFKVYHYAWQFDNDKKAGMDEEKLAKLHSGIIYQSAWERDMDWPSEGGNWTNHLARRLRRALGRI